MPDDLSKLTPTDPSTVDPDWTDKRQGILDGVLADTSRRRRHIGGWVAGVAAVALVAVAVGGAVQQFRPAPYATPAPPTASGPELLATSSLLLGDGDEVGVCIGGIGYSNPPHCTTIPVTGITWADVPWAETANGTTVGDAIMVGTFADGSFAATEVFKTDDAAAPHPPIAPEPGDFPTLCDAPVKGTGSGSTDALTATAEKLPGYQAHWVSPNQSTFNVAVTEDLEGARSAVSEIFGGEVCVGTLDGPTDEVLKSAQQSLEPLTTQPRVEGPTLDIPHDPVIWGSSYGVSSRAHRLGVIVLVQTASVLEQVEAAVGPVVWEYTDVSPFFYPVESTEPPTPDPITTSVANEPIVAARDTLIDTGNGMTICNGYALESRPPQCPFPTPVRGITWDDVPWAETADGITFDRTPGSITFADAITVGTFEGDAFVVTQVFRDDDPAAPQPPDTITDEDLPTLCDAPTRGAGPDSVEDLIVAAENLPGYQSLWVSPNQVTYNVAVTEDVEDARSALAKVFGGELCVGTVDGPTDQALRDAELALEPLKPDVDYATTTAGSVWSTFSSVSTRGNRLEVSVRRDTPDLLDKIQAVVGPDVWPHTDVIPFFYPVEGSATQDPTSSETSSEPSRITTTPGLTDEQRGWAEATVAGVLRSAGQADQPDVTARVAKVTYGQYMAVWNIDIPEPPGPTPDDAEILVIALSASLDGSAMRGEAPSLITPEATASQAPRVPIGTVTVLDPGTGETLSHATILGGEPPADLLIPMAGAFEDVALPNGFR